MPPRKYYYYETKNIVLDIFDLEKLVRDFNGPDLVVPYYYVNEDKISKYGLRLENDRLKVIKLKIQVGNKSRIFVFHLITSFDINPASVYTVANKRRSGIYNILDFGRNNTIFYVKNVDLTDRMKMINVKYYGDLV